MSRDPDHFRRDLAEALPHWVAQGLISAEQADGLRAHHRLDALEDQVGARMSAVLLALGATVIGLGLVSFVAANWEAITPGTRVLGATLLMLAADVLGWRWLDTPGRARLADVALVLGAFLFGADLALVAQWFQLTGDGGGLFFVWGVGTLGMAWALRHVPTASVGAAVLLGATASEALAPCCWAWACRRPTSGSPTARASGSGWAWCWSPRRWAPASSSSTPACCSRRRPSWRGGAC